MLIDAPLLTDGILHLADRALLGMSQLTRGGGAESRSALEHAGAEPVRGRKLNMPPVRGRSLSLDERTGSNDKDCSGEPR